MERFQESSNTSVFPELLRSLRIRSGLTQGELAEKAKLSARTISDLERGVRRKAYQSTVKMLSDAMALDPGEATRLAASVDRSRTRRVSPLSGTGNRDVLGLLLQSVGEAVIATDLQGTVIFWNAAASELYGYSADEALGRSIYNLTVPDITERQARDIMRSLNSGLVWNGQFKVKDKSGGTFQVHVTDVPVVDSRDDLALIIGFSRAEIAVPSDGPLAK